MPNAIPSTPADGNVKVAVATVVAGTVPTLAELADAVDISCYLTADGFSFAQEQATITDERLCSTETFNLPGRKSYTLTLTGIDNTNSELETEYNEFVESLPEGASRVLVHRAGLAYDEPFAADQKVRMIPVMVGAKTEMAPEANSVLRSQINTFVSGPSEMVTLAA